MFSLADSQGTYRFDNAVLIKGETLSFNDFSKVEASIFPNPAQSFINIKGNILEDTASIYNVTGQLISKKAITGSTNDLDISLLVKCIYFLYLKSGASYKFVKQ